jgi:hypothetical protein
MQHGQSASNAAAPPAHLNGAPVGAATAELVCHQLAIITAAGTLGKMHRQQVNKSAETAGEDAGLSTLLRQTRIVPSCMQEKGGGKEKQPHVHYPCSCTSPSTLYRSYM